MLALSCGLCQTIPAKQEDVHKVKTAYDYLIAMQNAPKPEPKPKIKKVKEKKIKKKKGKITQEILPSLGTFNHIDWSTMLIEDMKATWTTFVVEDEDHNLTHPLMTKLTYGDIKNLVFELFTRLEQK